MGGNDTLTAREVACPFAADQSIYAQMAVDGTTNLEQPRRSTRHLPVV